MMITAVKTLKHLTHSHSESVHLTQVRSKFMFQHTYVSVYSLLTDIRCLRMALSKVKWTTVHGGVTGGCLADVMLSNTCRIV